jgi:tRNA nucleotidyltransferase (CCA-adding enzyme)
VVARVNARWWHFEHAADMGVAGEGANLAEAFEQAALALMAVVTDVPVARDRCVDIHCEAPNAELLFVDFLNAIVYEMATQHLLFAAFEVDTDGRRLEAKAWGEVVDVARHQPAVEIKGATYTALAVQQSEDGRWRAQCVVDV